jgi:hypothetical protein
MTARFFRCSCNSGLPSTPVVEENSCWNKLPRAVANVVTGEQAWALSIRIWECRCLTLGLPDGLFSNQYGQIFESWGMVINFMAIWNIFRTFEILYICPFGTLCVHLVHFSGFSIGNVPRKIWQPCLTQKLVQKLSICKLPTWTLAACLIGIVSACHRGGCSYASWDRIPTGCFLLPYLSGSCFMPGVMHQSILMPRV